MCGSTRSTTSPSSSSTSRRTPCAAGCCGPKFMVKFRSSASAITLSLGCLLVTRQAVTGTLPGREKIEGAEFLRELHRLIDDALLLVVIADLDKSGERKILAQRIAFEAVGAGKDFDDRRHRGALVHFNLDPDALVLLGREEMIDHVEAALTPRPIDRGDIDNAPELTAFIVAQKGHDLDDVARQGRDGKLTVGHTMVQHRARQRAGDGLAKLVENFIHGRTSVTPRWCRRG